MGGQRLSVSRHSRFGAQFRTRTVVTRQYIIGGEGGKIVKSMLMFLDDVWPYLLFPFFFFVRPKRKGTKIEASIAHRYLCTLYPNHATIASLSSSLPRRPPRYIPPLIPHARPSSTTSNNNPPHKPDRRLLIPPHLQLQLQLHTQKMVPAITTNLLGVPGRHSLPSRRYTARRFPQREAVGSVLVAEDQELPFVRGYGAVGG